MFEETLLSRKRQSNAQAEVSHLKLKIALSNQGSSATLGAGKPLLPVARFAMAYLPLSMSAAASGVISALEWRAPAMSGSGGPQSRMSRGERSSVSS